MIIPGIDRTPTGSGEGINEETEEAIIVETVIDDEEKDAESKLR
jgi:hypothetical protein